MHNIVSGSYGRKEVEFSTKIAYTRDRQGGIGMIYTMDEIRAKIKPIADKYDVTEMYLFGSYARGEADEESDLDFAVQEKGTQLIGMEFIGFQLELEDAFDLPVSLISVDAVHKPITRFPNRFAPRFDRDKVSIL